MRIDVLTLFPDMFQAVLNTSIIGNAVEKQIVQLNYHNIRDFAGNKHNRVDDSPYGGGLGMVMQCGPIISTYEHVCSQVDTKPHVIMMSPYGKIFDQAKAKELQQYENIVFICGHYEGIDYRVNELIVNEEISLGNFILTGGEIPAMAMIDSVVRLLPGALKSQETHDVESYSNGLLEYPQYTRPPVFRDKEVPEILFSGHHANIVKWRHYESLKMTYWKRKDLLNLKTMDEKDKELLKKIKKELKNKK